MYQRSLITTHQILDSWDGCPNELHPLFEGSLKACKYWLSTEGQKNMYWEDDREPMLAEIGGRITSWVL